MIYLDNAATKMGNYKKFNINSPYAQSARETFEKARQTIADVFKVPKEHIYFTSGGCEANSWALQRCGAIHIITTKIEHPSVLNCCHYLETHGVMVTYLNVDKKGLVSPYDLDEALNKSPLAPTLVSIMYVNNEIGTVQDLKALRKVIDKHNEYREKASTETLLEFAEPIYFHSDCVQAAGQLPIPVDCLDMMSVSGHKFGRDFGIGFLYSKVPLSPLIFGGSQERGIRGGTSNFLPAINMAQSLSIRTSDGTYNTHIEIMLGYLMGSLAKLGIETGIEYQVNTPIETDTYHSSILSVSFKGVDAEKLMVFLADHEIYVSSGSACETDHKEPSHVLKAIGVPEEFINGTIRFSLSEFIGTDQIDQTMEIIKLYLEAINE